MLKLDFFPDVLRVLLIHTIKDLLDLFSPFSLSLLSSDYDLSLSSVKFPIIGQLFVLFVVPKVWNHAYFLVKQRYLLWFSEKYSLGHIRFLFPIRKVEKYK